MSFRFGTITLVAPVSTTVFSLRTIEIVCCLFPLGFNLIGTPPLPLPIFTVLVTFPFLYPVMIPSISISSFRGLLALNEKTGLVMSSFTSSSCKKSGKLVNSTSVGFTSISGLMVPFTSLTVIAARIAVGVILKEPVPWA